MQLLKFYIGISLENFNRNIQNFRMSKSQQFSCKTEQKIQHFLPCNYRSLTQLKNKEDAPPINAEILTVCRDKVGCKISVSPDTLKDQLLQLIAEFDTKATKTLTTHLEDWMRDRWTSLKMSLSSRLNKLHYLCPSLVNQTFGALQKEILIEWKKNTFLQGFLLLSSYTFTSHKFSNIQEIQQFYNHLRTIISQITFILFESCLQHLIQKQFPLEDKLYNYTAISIVTSSKQWPNIVEKVIKPNFYRSCPSFSENYNLNDLNIPEHLIDLEQSQGLFKNTAKSVRNLDQIYSPAGIIAGLREYRKNLVQQIQKSINNWRKKKQSSKQIVLEKEDILACIIYLLVTYKMDNIGVFLKYLSFLFEKELEAVLGSFQADLYRVDLEVAYQYLTQPVLSLSIDDLAKLESQATTSA